MIADSCGSREIQVDILELLVKVKEKGNNVLSFFFFPTFVLKSMKGLRNGHCFKN